MEYQAKYFEDGKYTGVEFPDLPGCFTQGNNLEEAERNINSAVDCYFNGSNETHKKMVSADKIIVIPVNVEYLGEKLQLKIKKAAGL